MSLEVGLTAFKQGRYAEAIEPLQAYCQECQDAGTTQSRSYMQAEMGLIKSYQGMQQMEQAIARCQALLDCDNEALKVWANRIMPSLSASPPAKATEETPAQTAAQPEDQIHLLETGLQAQKAGKLDQAIPALEAYLDQCKHVKSRKYMQAQMALIKAYRDGGEPEKAFAQCQPLLESENTALSCWAAKAIGPLQSACAATGAPGETAVSETANNGAAPASTASTAAPAGQSAARTPAPSSSSTPAKSSPKSSTYEFSAKPVTASGGTSSATASANSRPTTSHRTSTRPLSQSPQSTAASQANKRSRSLGVGGLSVGVLALLFGSRRTRRAVFVVVGVAIGIVRGCLEAGNFDYASTEAVSLGEIPALHIAAIEGDVATVQTLLQQGSDIDSADEIGNTPLFWAVSAGCYPFDEICPTTSEHQQIVEIFLSSGADANATNLYDETPLHWAAAVNNVQGVETLINFGAMVNSQSLEGYTPLDWATFTDASSVVDLLQSKGGVVSAPALAE